MVGGTLNPPRRGDSQSGCVQKIVDTLVPDDILLSQWLLTSTSRPGMTSVRIEFVPMKNTEDESFLSL